MLCSGIFHGHTDMVFRFLCNIWWLLWHSTSYWRGEISWYLQSIIVVSSKYYCSMLLVLTQFFYVDTNIRHAEK